MKNQDDISRQEEDLIQKSKKLCMDLEAEMAGASALMEAETLLDSKNPDYISGFLSGFAHCMKLGECFDAINIKTNGRPF